MLTVFAKLPTSLHKDLGESNIMTAEKHGDRCCHGVVTFRRTSSCKNSNKDTLAHIYAHSCHKDHMIISLKRSNFRVMPDINLIMNGTTHTHIG